MNRKTFIPPAYKRILLVGVGGTGSYLAQGLAKMIAGYKLDIEVLLVDPDFVEEKNCKRQNYLAYEINQSKVEALSTRLNMQYGTDLMFGLGDGDEYLEGFTHRDRLIVSCVDSVSARKTLIGHGHWLDMGNGESSGQAIFGTTADHLQTQLDQWDMFPTVGALPCPATVVGLQYLKDDKKIPNCADHPFNEQGPFVNEWAAQAGLTILHKLLIKGELDINRIYFDANKGRMTPGFITKEIFNG